MLHGKRLITLLLVVVLLNPSRILSGKVQKPRDSDEADGLEKRMLENPVQQRDNKNLASDVRAAFEHAQHHHLHERQIQEKPVIHHAEESDQGNQDHGLDRHHDNTDSGSNLDKDGEIHLEGLDRRARDNQKENEDFSGEEHGRRVEIRDIHYHIHKTQHTREASDGRESKHELSGENSRKEKLHFHHKTSRSSNNDQWNDDHENSTWEHFEMHLHSHGENDKDGEFGYLTAEKAELLEDNDDEDNDDEALSGEQEYDHKHLKTIHVHHGVQHVKRSRDSQVGGETIQLDNDEDNEYSGDTYVHRHVKQARRTRDSHMSGGRIKQETSGEEDEGGGYSGEEDDKVNNKRDMDLPQELGKVFEAGSDESETGEYEEASGKGQEQIPEDNDKDKSVRKGDAKEGKKAVQKLSKSKSREKAQSSGNNRGSRNSEKPKVYKLKINLMHLSKDFKNKDDDFYIVEKDEPEDKQHEVEMRDFEEEKRIANPGKRQIDKRTQGEDDDTEKVDSYRSPSSSRHLLQFNNENPSLGYISESSTQCTHPAFADKIPDDAIIYIRAECRLCECKMGELSCEPKPQLCDQHLGNKPCVMEQEGTMADGEIRFDGCNNCLCRNGELLCTRVRCPLANFNYTDYRVLSNNTLQNATKANVYEEHIGGKDTCMECDYEPIAPVCGPNWKTYRSMCHAMECGGHKIDHVKEGACEKMNPCDEAKCADHEICLIHKRGPCLASTTTDGDIVECQQYQCVNPSQDCSSVLVRKVCGEDHKTYSSECAMYARGIALAYYGLCKEECTEDDTTMCGVDGVTFASSCHAALLNSHVDYPGECDEVDPQNNVFMSSTDLYYNRRCKTVKELARCPDIECTKHVVAEGSCCPACGTAISIRLDPAVKDMTAFETTQDQPFYQLNRLSLIYDSLQTLSNQFGGLGKCQLTADLVDTNDISVVYKPIKTEDKEMCEQMARKTVDLINSRDKDDVDPGLAILAVAVVVDRPEITFAPRVEVLTSLVGKSRKKRGIHHEHEPYFNYNERIYPQTTFVLFLAALVLYWSTNLAAF